MDGSSTASNELEGTVFFQKKAGPHYALGIGLRENGDRKPSFTERDKKTLLVKIVDNTYEFPLQAPNGTLYAGLDRYSYDADWLMDRLCGGTDLRCVIYLGDSKYSFDLESANLPLLLENEGIAPGSAEMTLKEALEVYITDADWTDDKDGYINAYNYLYKHINDFALMTTDDLERDIQGSFLETEVTQSTGGGYWVIRKYEGSNAQQLHWWAWHDERVNADDITRDRSEDPLPISVENDLLKRGMLGAAQVRRIADGIYIRYIHGVEEGYRAPDYLMFSYDGPYRWQSDLDEMSAEVLRHVITSIGGTD